MATGQGYDEVVMPRLSDTMEEGTVGRWLCTVNDHVEKGDELVEIDTDKVTTTIRAEASGYVLALRAAEGDSIAVGQTLALIGAEPGVFLPEPQISVVAPANEVALAATPHELVVADSRAPGLGPTSRIPSSPLARALARRAGVALESLLPGSGPNGRVLRQDVERHVRSQRPIVRSAPGRTVEEPTRLHRLLAERVAASKREVPHFYVSSDAVMTASRELLCDLNGAAEGVRVTVTALVVRACALALQAVPSVNSSWVDGSLVRHQEVNVGVAVGLNDEELLVPVLRRADGKRLSELARAIDELADRARSGSLQAHELEHGSFTVSNLGMFRVDEFHAIINPPESAILAVGRITEHPLIVDGTLRSEERMRLSLSADHRVVSGVTAARFLDHIVTSLEHPARLLF